MRPPTDVVRARPKHLRYLLIAVPGDEQPEQGALVLAQRHGPARGRSALLARAALLCLARLALGLLQQLVEAQLGDAALKHRVTDERDDAGRLLALRLERLLDLLRLSGGYLREPDRAERRAQQHLMRDQRAAALDVCTRGGGVLTERQVLGVGLVKPEQVPVAVLTGLQMDRVGLQDEG